MRRRQAPELGITEAGVDVDDVVTHRGQVVSMNRLAPISIARDLSASASAIVSPAIS